MKSYPSSRDIKIAIQFKSFAKFSESTEALITNALTIKNLIELLKTRNSMKIFWRFIYDTKRRYGAPKIHRELLEKGWHVSLKRVQRRMAFLGICSVLIKKYRHFSDNKPVTEKETLLKQDFTTTGINKKWCTDITYIHTQKDGWTYLASVMDFYSRKVIGWAYGTTMTTELAVKAVKNEC